ncbi:MAG: potassium-transporting ATPase subunit KdpA [Proteobacteria bacterium]|nr:potassium-transporting ATPase subunit KdpA [Burkholderiales bacterium]
MSAVPFLSSLFFLAVLTASVKPLGRYMARVYQGERTLLSPVLGPLERIVYRVAGVDASASMHWTRYAFAMLWLNVLGALAVYGLQRAQSILPANPQSMGAVSADSAFNTAVSFATNTNWQGYAGEATMSYLTQMLGLAVQNFVSAACGMAVLIALIRGFSSRNSDSIGNFWVDCTRSILYVLLPLSLLLAGALVTQGVVQSFSPYATVALVQPVDHEKAAEDAEGKPRLDAEGKPVMEAARTTEQKVPLGPAASQVAIKQLGTNGGGFFNVNSAHPFENPTPLSNFLQVLAILLIPAAFCYTFGAMVGDTRQGWAIYAAMTFVFVALLGVATWAEQTGNPQLAARGVDDRASALQSGGNMEGKEVRFGIAASALWATTTTAASNGSVNSMHDSYTPLGGAVPMWLMQLGEVIYGGVGSGLYGMLVFAIIGVFIAGLMIGRTPEYLGKKLEAFEIKMAAIVILVPPLFVLAGTALAVMSEAGRAGIANPGAHGFSEILYALSSAGNNNGSAFAGLSANTPFYNTLLGVAMWCSRYWLAIPVLAIAGSLAAKKTVPSGPGTLPTHTPLFVALLIGTVLVVGALTFVPALALGPIVEHLLLYPAR